MVVFSIVKLSKLEGAKRIDAEFYSPYYFDLEKKIKNKKWDYLGNLIIFNRRGIQPKYSSTPTKYRAVISQNILEDFLDVSNLQFVEEKFFNSKRAQEVKIKPFDILIYTTGANIGRTNIFYTKTIEAVASNHVNILRIDSSKINPLYVGVFLQSKIGRSWSDRWSSGSDQKEIYPEDFEKFPILIPGSKFQNEVANLVLESFRLIEDSNNSYFQAENLLLEELGLKDFKLKYKKTYTSSLCDTFSAHRIDAEYFQPAYEEVVEKIRERGIELKLLKEIAERIKIKINPQKDKVYRYIEISDVSIDIGDIGYTERLGKDLPPNARIPVKGGELIISKVRPTRGAIGIIPSDLGDNVICSSAFSVFSVSSPLREVIYIFSRSTLGKLQLEKPTKGTSYPTIEDEDVENLKIPLLPLETQQKIAELIQKSHEARKKAKELLERAKRAVEIAIEKDEKEALDYISKTT